MAIFGVVESDFIAILALCVAGGSSAFTAFTYLKTYSRNRKSAQIKIAREVHDKIDENFDKFLDYVTSKRFPEKDSVEDKRSWVENVLTLLGNTLRPMRYFTYLVKQKEINDTTVLNYYKEAIHDHLKLMDKRYTFIGEKIGKEEEIKLYSSLPTDIEEFRNELQQMMKVWR